MRWVVATLLVLGSMSLASEATAKEVRYDKLAPYSAVRFESNRIHIQVDGTWHQLMSINGVKVKELVSFSKKTFRRKWKRRITEDLVEVMARMGKPTKGTVDLGVVNPTSGETKTLTAVAMTHRKRQAAQAYRVSGPPEQIQRVKREHASRVDSRYADLARPIAGAPSPAKTALQIREDLEQLEWLITHRYAYRDLQGVDVKAAMDAIHSSVGDGLTRNDFAIRIMKLLALFGDGHARIDMNPLVGGFLPFLIEETSEGFVAFRPDRAGVLEAGYPLITHLDGRPLREWLEASARLVPQGSMQWKQRGAMRGLRHVSHLRRELGLAEALTLKVTLESSGRAKTKDVTVDLVRRKPNYGVWPDSETRFVSVGSSKRKIGVLRIASMSRKAQATQAIDEAMADFKNTVGLVVDVRGNGGGTRDILRRFLPYLMSKKDGAWIANIAAYRLEKDDKPDVAEGYLENRSLYPAAHSSWENKTRKTVRTWLGTFRPTWSPPEGEFSAWHAMAITHDDNPKAYTYKKPVVVLIDSSCFSATDIFVGALAGRKRVTLMGTATGGGSARSRKYTLVHSGINVKLASMASFRPDGSLYDTQGIAPDLKMVHTTSDVLGTTDSVLDAAIKRLSK